MWIDLPHPWCCLFIPLPSLPLKQHQRSGVRDTVEKIVGYLRGCAPLHLTTWLLMDSLHKDGAVRELSRNGRHWMPDFGLGIWPDREPPRMYEDRDFLDLEYGAKFPQMVHSVVKAGMTEDAALHAWRTMFGTGSTILTLADGSSDNMLEAVREPLLAAIQDESFRSFPWYFPLLGRNSLGHEKEGLLDCWLGPACVYIRESEEDSGLLAISRMDLKPALLAAGFEIG